MGSLKKKKTTIDSVDLTQIRSTHSGKGKSYPFLERFIDSFVRDLSKKLTHTLKSHYSISHLNREFWPYGEFINTLSSHVCLSVGLFTRIKEHFLIHFDLPLTDLLIGHSYGGRISSSSLKGEKNFTNLELGLLKKYAYDVIEVLEGSLSQKKGPLGAEFVGMETNPQFLGFATPKDIYWVCSFEVSEGNVMGVISLILSERSLKSCQREKF